MEMHAANDPPGSDFAIEALFLVTLIVTALFVSCVLAWKAIAWLRNRKKGDGVAAEGEQKRYAPEGFGREGFGAAVTGSHLTDMAGFSEREEGGVPPPPWPQEGTQGHQATPEGAGAS